MFITMDTYLLWYSLMLLDLSHFLVPEVQDVTVMPQYSRINVNLSDTLTTIMVEILREPVSFCHHHQMLSVNKSFAY